MIFPMVAAVCDEIKASPLYGKDSWPGHEKARKVYAAEMLPTILGGEWFVPRRNASFPIILLPEDTRYRLSMTVLFDHGTVFRRRGTRGPATLKNVAVIGQPYDLFSERRVAPEDAIELAQYLETLGVGTWARPDLSSWYPGWTSLVIAAAGLLDLDPAKFGFQSLR